jgi:two-component system, NarL family, response regulator LiaR
MSQSQEPKTDGVRILLVEDHELIRVGITAIIEQTKDLKIVGEAVDGEQAVTLASALKPDLILMDVGLPNMDGIDAVREIKATQPQIPIMMLTAHDDDCEIVASLSAGASGYCLKNVEPDRLINAIRSVYAGDLWIDNAIAAKVMSIYSQTPAPALPPPSTNIEPPSAPGGDLVSDLSPRELEVLYLLVNGLGNQQIADQLNISLATAKTHVRSILHKLSVNDRTLAAVQAMRLGLIRS